MEVPEPNFLKHEDAVEQCWPQDGLGNNKVKKTVFSYKWIIVRTLFWLVKTKYSQIGSYSRNLEQKLSTNKTLLSASVLAENSIPNRATTSETSVKP